MERLGQKIVRLFNSVTQPLPSPEKEEDKFLGGLNHLSLREIRGVLKIVIDQTKESRKYGLYISGELLEKEEAFFLVGLNELGGVANVKNNYKFEDVSRVIANTAGAFFEKESREFHEKFSKAKTGAKTRYDVHLELTRGAILNAVYDNRII